MRSLLHVVIVASVAVAAGCNSKELTRAKVKSLLEQTGQLKPKRVRFSLGNQELVRTSSAGYWQAQQCAGGTYTFRLTPEGTKYFEEVGASGAWLAERWCVWNLGDLKTREPLSPVVEVTGISDFAFGGKQSIKLAELEWGWDVSGLPQQLAVVLQNRKKQAQVKCVLYDDGWRVGEVDFSRDSLGGEETF